jgi:putative membrane protein
MDIQDVKAPSTARPPHSEVCSKEFVEDPSGSEAQRQNTPAGSRARDELAEYRSMLANERTLLAYQRTAIMLAVSGFTLLKLLSHETHALVLGTALLSVAFTTTIIGFVRFRKMKSQITDCDGFPTQRAQGNQPRMTSFEARHDYLGPILPARCKTRQTERSVAHGAC